MSREKTYEPGKRTEAVVLKGEQEVEGRFEETLTFEVPPHKTLEELGYPQFGDIEAKIQPKNRTVSQFSVRRVKDLDGDGIPDFPVDSDFEKGTLELREFAKEVEQRCQVVPLGTHASEPGGLMFYSKVEKLDSVHAKRCDYYASEWCSKERSFRDPETGLTVEESRTVKDTFEEVPEDSAGSEYTKVDLSCYHYVLVARTLVGWEDFNQPVVTEWEWQFIEYTFPAFLIPSQWDDNLFFHGIGNPTTHFFKSNSIFLVGRLRTIFHYAPRRRSAISTTVPAKVVITWHDVRPDPDVGLVDIQTTDVVYEGVMFNLNERNVLMDSTGFMARTDADDTYHGSNVEEHTGTFKPSVPTSTQYLTDWIGSERLIGQEIRRGEFGLWKNTRWYITFR